MTQKMTVSRLATEHWEEAAYWLSALRDQPSPALLNRWEKWLAVPANRQAFDQAQQIWELMDQITPSWPTDAEVKADTYDGSIPIAAVEERFQEERHWRDHRFAWIATAASVAVVVMSLARTITEFAIPRPASVTVFETAAAQHEKVTLIDGSEIQMGARTAVTASVSRESRSIVIDRGEAFFNVAHDPKRPFRVLAGAGVITAVGTSFNVRRLDGAVVVTVSEGTVEVERVNAISARQVSTRTHGKKVSRGQSVSYDGDGNLGEIRRVDPDSAISWLDGHLLYENEPLSQVILDVNRYSVKQIVIADAAAGRILYSGTVFERDIADWLKALEKMFPEIEVIESQHDYVVIRSRAVSGAI